MLPEIGHFALILALFLALAQAPVMALAGAREDARLAAAGARCAVLLWGAVVLAFACLTAAYLASDFSVANVYRNSHGDKPLLYKITGVWGNHEGSMLLWVLILATFSGLLAYSRRRGFERLDAFALAAQALIAAAFLAFILFTSNPFERFWPAPPQGQGLNPLLQDIGLAIHPPLLYLGYVGFSIPFAYAVAGLITGRIDRAWARAVRPWALGAWCFLTIGIVLGAWWAYYELGWGGWWAWDPVENASFMPWLAGTALIHSIRVVERRDAFKAWALLLAIATFSLSLVGTFLVRSGILTSVHAFAVDPERGVFILAILAIATGGALTLYAMRAGALQAGGAFAPASRETSLVFNNVLLCAACATVFFGTFYPLFVDIASGARISVGAPYFNAVFVPLALCALAGAALGPLLAWKRADLRDLARRMAPVAGAGLVAALLLLAIIERERASGALAILLIVFLAGGAVADIAGRVQLFRAPVQTSLSRARRLPRGAWGTAIAHFGLALFALGATGVSLWKEERVLRMSPGDSAEISGFEVTLEDVALLRGPNYEAERAVFTARKGARAARISAERRFYPVRAMATTEAGIRSFGAGDLYLTFGENTGGGWPVKLRLFPLVGCLWWGAGICAFGGALAWSDRERRRASEVLEESERKLAAAPA